MYSEMNRDPIEDLYFRSKAVNTPRNGIATHAVRTPRPTPNIFQEKETFSTKKERERSFTPRDCLPPKPPVKSAPPVSRIFPNRQIIRAQAVSFKTRDTSLVSPHYNTDSKRLYFDQCFEIDARLGCGSFGEVFKVRSKEDGRFYAIKRSRERFRGESDRKRKLQEVAKHEKLPKHPNCVEFIRAWEEKQHLYIQTELCKTSLSNFAEQNHHISERLIWNYLVDLLMAVNHLHSNDLIHMDIKPDNIFISDNGVCKLGDFGLVIDAANCVESGEAQEGDPKYLAPELMQGKFGKPADIFSLGVTVLELASDLDLPRGGDLWHDLRAGRFPDEFMLGLSPDLRSVIEWVMSADPVKRPTAEEVLASPLVVRTWKRRRRVQTMQSCINSVNSMLHGLLPEQFRTPTKTPTRPSHPPEWDNSFSDEDSFEGGASISIHNNSMGVPLDLSTSSEDSVKDADGFAVPSLPLARHALTTPAQRFRPGGGRPGYQQFDPSSNSSPLSVYARYSPTLLGRASPTGVIVSALRPTHNIFSSSPVQSSGPPIHRSFLRMETDEITPEITPNSSFSEKSDDGEPSAKMATPGKLGIEPKNLLDAFEGASSEED